MGKVIETKYRDVSHRIIKKPLKKEKGNKKPASITKPKNDSLPCKLPIENNFQEPSTTENVSLMETELPQSVFNKLEFEALKGCSADDIRLQAKEIDKQDLFLRDELTSSYVNYVNTDFGFRIVDEISLEGLDGITVEALWKRLTDLEQPVNINGNIKEVIWQFICNKRDIEFYELPEPRGALEIYDRSKNINTHIGVVIELAYELPDIYPHNLINDPDVQGSCAKFNTRVKISYEDRKMTLKCAEEKGLVMVATQKLRNKAIFYETADPTVELQNMEYCILERIGRSRKHGELTQGNMSITSHFKMDPKSVFHYKKKLIQNNLLAKQFFYIKSAVTEQNKTGRLVHLKRFFHKLKPKPLLIAEQIVNIMKTKPYNRIEYSELRKVFPDNASSISRIIKSSEFHKFVKTDCFVPYRELYPNATMSEYMSKSKPTEKILRCLTLIDPYVNLSATWANEPEDSDVDDEDGEEGVIGAKIFNMGCVGEVFHHIMSKGKQGCTLQELHKLVGIDNNSIRMVVKKLLAKNVVAVLKIDKGKQRHLVYYARCLDDEEVTIRQNPEPPKLPNNILAKFKQRQRDAIEKTKLVAKKEDAVSKSTIKFPRLIETETPNIKCGYFIETHLNSSVAEKLYVQATFDASIRKNILKLLVKLFNSEQLFNINQVLREIIPIETPPQLGANFTETYTRKTDTNYITKLILLKATFGEIVINANNLNSLDRKRKRLVEIQVPKLLDESQVVNQKSQSASKLDYMGDSPVVVFTEKEENINVEIVVSTVPNEFKDDSVYPETRELSERVKSRIKVILDIVYEKKIVEDMWKLIKYIHDKEHKEGYTRKIDRKSLARILKKLVEEGYLKIYKLVIWDINITKSYQFVCHPSASHTDSLIQSVCQQQKWKYFLGATKKAVKPYVPSMQEKLEKKVSDSPFSRFDIMHSIAEFKEMNKIKFKEMKARYNRQCGRLHGFKPKFIRMRVIHEFLFYLIYEYDKNTKQLTMEEKEKLFESYHIDVTEEDLKKIPPIYIKEISWKTFIPPLPYHEGYESWALVCDVILRLPISVLCKVHNISYELPELSEILKHPIKRFYLVKDLPEHIRYLVLFKRKYLFTIHESLMRLAYAGLLQFGPQKYKEKDQVFIYLNRRASLLDTTSSEPSYHKVTNKEYKQLAFFLNTSTDVESYWYNAYGICLSTKLNAKQPGQLVTLCDPSTKPDLVGALKSKMPKQAVEDDNGETPGDRRGAGGFDSSMWAHIERNWFWAQKKIMSHSADSLGLNKERLEKNMISTQLKLPYEELTNFAISKVYLHKNTADEKEPKTKKLKKRLPVPLKPSKSVQKITRKIPYRPKRNVRQYYDHLDKVILKKIGNKTRVRWTAQQDKVLMLCKVASIFLNPRFPKKQAVPYTVLRDVLHRMCPESKNKTSRACQRRLKQHIMEVYPHLIEYSANLLRIKPISDYFAIFVHNLLREQTSEGKPFKIKDSQLSTAFVILMSYIARHKEDVESVLHGNQLTIDHFTDGGLSNVELHAYELEQSPLKYEDVRNDEDIKRDVLKSVIHSTLGSKTEPGWTFQLLRIYQRYPDSLIREAVGELQHSQTISIKKFMKKKNMARSYMPFHLSNVYVYSLASSFSLTTAIETYKTFRNITSNKKFLDFSMETILEKKYGQLLGLNEFCTIWDSVQFKFFLPQHTVILNPDITDHSELVKELAVRWQTRMKKLLQENVEAEQDPEPDNDRSKPEEFNATTDKEPTNLIDTTDEIQNSPLDLTVDRSSAETINRLKTWVTDCMETERERRSPSPEFVTLDEPEDVENGKIRKKTVEEQVCNNEEVSRATKKTDRDQIPTLEEIKEGMLEPDLDDKPRIVPYITDLSSLLNREYFTESQSNDKKIERLKNHFITQYAVLEDFIVEERDQLENSYMAKYLQDSLKNKKIWERLRSTLILEDPEDTSQIFERLMQQGATDKDVALANDVIQFVFARNVLGATGVEIKKHHKHLEETYALEDIIKVLTDLRILIRVGTCTITFVHYRFQSTWLVETFTLSHEEQKILEEETAKVKKDVKKNIDKRLEEKKLIRIQVMPWIKIDGTLNEDGFKLWLCNVVSHCLDYPKITFMKLCEKFCFLKPVDIYFLLEILQELGCLEVRLYNTRENTLFSSWEVIEETDATCLDNFEDMYVETSNVSMTLLGSFFYDNQSE